MFTRLAEPFDPREIKWRVTNTAAFRDKRGQRLRGRVIAYGDPRAYQDRLNELFTPSGWTRRYSVQVVQNFERRAKGSESCVTAKIVVTCELTIFGFGTHAGLGEEWADDENAGTSAEAQAFKRACSCFGLGRYLYDLDGGWVDLDERKQPLEKPRLPEFALPVSQRNTKGAGSANGHHRNGVVRDDVVARLKQLEGEVGLGLSRWALHQVAKVDSIEKVRNFAHLQSLLEKTTDLARGVERLRRAITTNGGAQRYVELVRELNLTSDAIDDIPDRAMLRTLVTRMEEGNTQSRAPDGGVSQMRGVFLQEATRVANERRRPLGDVVAELSDGDFTLATLKQMTEADIPRLRAALERLRSVRQGRS
ncbi:MAG: hypothetical protein KIT09_16065 [Bryobacteraceae bacterium]|nr:hypothetical protein [Bryobacteraceae bacterium]